MSQSAAFAQIKAQILALTATIPPGRVSTYHSIGDYLDVMPRHVAYILTTLNPDEKEIIPWYRVVADSGKITAPNPAKAANQKLALEQEGLLFQGKRDILNFSEYFIPADDLNSGISRQTRPHG